MGTIAAALTCSLSLEIAGGLLIGKKSQVIAEITGLSANLQFEALDAQKNCWYQFWHLDNHLRSAKTPPEVHPLYHLNFGGQRLASCRLDGANKLFFGLVELEAPRIQLPPMDAVLLVDFVLSNFDGKRPRGCLLAGG